MTRFSWLKIQKVTLHSLIGLTLSSATLLAQAAKVEGLIQGRNGDTMILKTSDSPNLVVHLTDSTDVGQVQGMFKARKKEMSMAALIPGLAVKVEGTYNSKNELVAQKIRFKGDDLKQAQAIDAGMHETKAQVQQSEEELAKHKEALAEQEAKLAEQQAKLAEHQTQLTEQQAKIAANKAAVDAAVARFGQLDDYYIFDELTVYFDNGKVKVDPKYNSQLVALTGKAKVIEGYMVEVKGYASSSGSAALNQKLSEDRANNVTNILIQQGHVPLTRMLAPGAMGESEQVGKEKTTEGQAENRRVVVRVLQNKAIAGSSIGTSQPPN